MITFDNKKRLMKIIKISSIFKKIYLLTAVSIPGSTRPENCHLEINISIIAKTA